MKTKYFSIIFFAIIMASCQKEKLTDPTPKSSETTNPSIDVSSKNGRLIFKDVDSYLNYNKWLSDHQNDPADIKAYNKTLNHRSMREIYDEGMSIIGLDQRNQHFKQYPRVSGVIEFDGTQLIELAGPSLLSYIANKDGIYQIGDEIYRITLTKRIIIENGDESEIFSSPSGDESEIFSLPSGDESEIFSTLSGDESEIFSLLPGDESEIFSLVSGDESEIFSLIRWGRIR